MLKFAHCITVTLCLAFANASYAQKFFAAENQDDGIAPRKSMRFEGYHAPTPLTAPGAKTVFTEDLYKMLQGNEKPVLIDVLGGGQHQTPSGAIWWAGAGLGYKSAIANGDLQTKFTRRLNEVTGGDKAKPVVFYCLSQACWLSYNAALRAVAAGYTSVLWYRGGIESWKAAGNSMSNSGPSKY